MADQLFRAWGLDGYHSSATFRVRYCNNPFRAEFERLEVQLVDGKLSGTVDVTSLRLKSELFDEIVQGPMFFDSATYKEIAFSSSSIQVDGSNIVVDGELTMKGITKPVRATGTIDGPVEDFMGKTRLPLTLTATIDRTEFGLNWDKPMPGGGQALADDVDLIVDVALVAADEEWPPVRSSSSS